LTGSIVSIASLTIGQLVVKLPKEWIMNRKIFSFLFSLLLPGLLVIPSGTLAPTMGSAARAKVVVYKSNFNSLNAGLTQPFPGAARQDGWFSELAISPAYGEIQKDNALGRHALHEFTSVSVPNFTQTIDKRLITPPDLSRYSIITLQVDFYAHSSDLNASDVYGVALAITGGPFPGFEIMQFSVNSGNGVPKGESGVNIGLSRFNGVDNNEPIPLTVGQNLAWDSWHRVTVIADQASDHYISLTVDRQSEDLSAYLLPRSEVAPGVFERGQLMEEIQAVIAPNSDFGGASDDDIYWDNLMITVKH
jgi:hypothetical protein